MKKPFPQFFVIVFTSPLFAHCRARFAVRGKEQTQPHLKTSPKNLPALDSRLTGRFSIDNYKRSDKSLNFYGMTVPSISTMQLRLDNLQLNFSHFNRREISTSSKKNKNTLSGKKYLFIPLTRCVNDFTEVNIIEKINFINFKNMKSFILLMFISVFISSAFAQEKGSFTDIRDGKTYKTVKIGDQVWMAENLNYFVNGSKCIWDFGDDLHTNNDDTANCTLYGRFYNFNSALEACPKGWHIPSIYEVEILINLLGGDSIAGAKLKTAGKEYWPNNTSESDNSSGFSAIATSFFPYSPQNVTFFWSYKMREDKGQPWMQPWMFELFDIFNEVWTQPKGKDNFCSLRCVKD